MEFEWDPLKAEDNFKKHGVDFTEAATVLSDPLSITYSDPDHSVDEDRYIIICSSSANRLLIVTHSDRDESTHLISAREVTSHERNFYEGED